MRNLTGAALSKIAEKYGNEPVAIIDISWVKGSTMQYADRDINSIKGRILEISNLDNVIKVSMSDDSQQITVTLDDTDGTIKNIMNNHDIHKRDVWVYQWFQGLDLSDRFLLFKGKINTPIIWSEGDQTVTITIISQIEDREVGFSPEEGQFPFIPRDLIGKTWPSIFGTAIDVPAVQIGRAVVGTTLCSIGVITGKATHDAENVGPDPPDLREAYTRKNYIESLATIFKEAGRKTDLKNEDGSYKYVINSEYQKRAEDCYDQVEAIGDQISKTWNSYLRQRDCAESKRQETSNTAEEQGIGCNPVRILGGEDFPRGTITLNIEGGLFTGFFEGESDIFVIKSRRHPEHAIEIARNEQNRDNVLYKGVYRTDPCTPVIPPPKDYLWETKVPPGYGNTSSDTAWPLIGTLRDMYTEKGTFYYGEPSRNDSVSQIMRHFWADAGSRVVLEGNEPITYIVSIVPGTVLQVKAFKDINGIQRLINVPSSMYTVSTQTYGTITAVQVTLNNPLSSLEDQNWSDDIYVTFRSDIGPNIVDILTYLIQTYTDLNIDTTSFNDVETKLEPFPANFALLTRKNIVEVLNEIAFQARCSLRLSNGIFYLKYLAEEPSTVDTISLDDIENQSVEVTLTPTEDIVTKYTVLWRVSYAQEDLNKIILRHNVRKYGIQEETYEYYIYNQPDIIHKISTFWLIRKANTWKRINFKLFFNKLNLETFDAILLQFDETYVANTDIKAIIERADIDGDNYVIIIECWLPVKSGEMSAYEFAWPANVSANWIFPTNREVNLGLDGGYGIGRNATGELPVGNIDGISSRTIYIGGPNILFGPQTDRGDPNPSDQGFVAQDLQIDSLFADINVVLKPSLNLLINYADKIDPVDLPEDLPNIVTLVLENTKVVSENSDNYGWLGDVLGVRENELLCIKTTAQFRGPTKDGECKTATFHFQYDTVADVWGAGTAFLREDNETIPEEIPTDENTWRDKNLECD